MKKYVLEKEVALVDCIVKEITPNLIIFEDNVTYETIGEYDDEKVARAEFNKMKSCIEYGIGTTILTYYNLLDEGRIIKQTPLKH